MGEPFKSDALIANIEQTKGALIQIPEHHLWFLSLSSEKWGIHKRTQEFMKELNHELRNDAFVIESLHTICLSDLWFYKDIDGALEVLLSIFEGLLENVSEDSDKGGLRQTLFKFIDRLVALEDFSDPIVWDALRLIEADLSKNDLIYIRHSKYFKMYLSKVGKIQRFEKAVLGLTKEVLLKCVAYWVTSTEANPLRIKREDLIGKPFFKHLTHMIQEANSWNDAEKLMTYHEIANHFRAVTDAIDSSLETIHYLHDLLHLPGMSHLSNHLLYDINRNLRHVFKELKPEAVTGFIDEMMKEFRALSAHSPGTVLDCALTFGKEIIATNDEMYLSYYIKQLTQMGFQYPGKLEMKNNWQTQVNPHHLKNIRVWLELIAFNPLATKELLSALIVHLKLGGIFISDTDLFQRDITKLLNANIKPVYRDIKQLAKQFPVYFRDIGAEGKLRTYSTAIDELSMRQDRLIHFMRKQIHTESNNTHITLVKNIYLYWCGENSDALKESLPNDILDWLKDEPHWVTEMRALLKELLKRSALKPIELLKMPIETSQALVMSSEGSSPLNQERLCLLFKVYRLLLEKYTLNTDALIQLIEDVHVIPKASVESFEKAATCSEGIDILFQWIGLLKRVILDPRPSEGFENIYYKRHVAVGIPSMYGQYIEPKFEALGLIYRIEQVASAKMLEWMNGVNLNYVNAKTLKEIDRILDAFKRGLDLDGIVNEGFNSRLSMLSYSLRSQSFSLDQYINIFEFVSKDIKQIMDEYFIKVFERPLKQIVPFLEGLTSEDILPESEKFYRDHLYTAFLIQDLDAFVTRIIDSIREMVDNYAYEMIQNMMTYDPDLTLTDLNAQSLTMDNPVFIGAKAYFLKRLKALNYPVPKGLVLTTEVYRHFQAIQNHFGIREEIRAKLFSALTRCFDKRLGDAENPLILSVRSGSSISLPGAMVTFLNVGLNDDIAEAAASRGNGFCVWDSYRRYLQCFGMAEGLPRSAFDDIIASYKVRFEVIKKSDLSTAQMKTIAMAYKGFIESNGIEVIQDVKRQLIDAIHHVIASWFSNSAKTYRSQMSIANEWGTAVLVQEMVFGNKSQSSGTGVVFTNNPKDDRAGIELVGDFVVGSQGEDVVSGLVETLPISIAQGKANGDETSFTLESHFPKIYQALKAYAKGLINEQGFVHQEIEFTFESPEPSDLYVLQTRNLKINQGRQDLLPPISAEAIGRGLGVISGQVKGHAAFDAEDIEAIRKTHPMAKVIVIRPYTVPDDIPLIFKSDGVITAKGGVTSHAAVTAASLGKVCVVNCKGIVFQKQDKQCVINGALIKKGDLIAIDGYLGNVYAMDLPIKKEGGF